MGIVRMGIPKELVKSLISEMSCDMFIETGTYLGDTALWADVYFKKVYTIEYSEEIYAIAKKRISESGRKIELLYGDSRSNLSEIYQEKQESALLWLDAHWCEGDSYGQYDQCPLIDELDIINQANHDDIILIDDARLFLAPPPLPNLIEYYPNMGETVNKLLEVDRYIAVFEDVIFAVPSKYATFFEKLLQEYTTADWNYRGSKKFNDKMKKSKADLKHLLKNWI